jgi:hypothetical protein
LVGSVGGGVGVVFRFPGIGVFVKSIGEG